MNPFRITIFVIFAIFLGFFLPTEFFINQKIDSTEIKTPSRPIILINTSSTTPILKQISTTTVEIKKTEQLIKKPVATNTPQIITAKTIEPPTDFEAINQFARKSIVNILCTTNTNKLSPISGTGVIIDQRGIILTNAHIGQYWLLRDYPSKNSIDCLIRTGNPAYPEYHAKLMYISINWVEKNKALLKETEPKGTGENDFAFLHITDKINKTDLPDNLSFIPPNIRENISEKETVVLISYPAEFLGGITILKNLFISSAITTIQKIFTFKENTIDLVSIGGTIISQKGASGGAVVDKNSSLIGLIATESDAANTGERDLRAITLAHINRSLKEETGGGLEDFLSQSPSDVAETFQGTTQQTLTKLITDELSRQ